MSTTAATRTVANVIAGEERGAVSGATFEKLDPASGEVLSLVARSGAEHVAAVVAAETGKSPSEAAGETGGAIEMGYFVAGEGRRLYGRTTTSAMPNRTVMTTRRPVGVAALIVSFNTPLPN